MVHHSPSKTVEEWKDFESNLTSGNVVMAISQYLLIWAELSLPEQNWL